MTDAFTTILGEDFVRGHDGAVFHHTKDGVLLPVAIEFSSSGLAKLTGLTSWMYVEDALMWWLQRQQMTELRAEVGSLQAQIWELRDRAHQ